MTVSNFSQVQPQPQILETPRPVRLNWWAGLLVAGIAMLLFALTRFGNFQGDDFTLLGQLTDTKRTLGSTLGFFGSDWGLIGKFYAPLPRLFFFVEYALFQSNAASWHLISATIHAANAGLVWWLVSRLLNRPGVAIIAGLFFAVQPLHVNIVAQISGQADLLATFFCLISAISFITARQRALAHNPAANSAQLFYWLSVGFYLLALLCKQEAIALPLALLGFDFVTGGLDRILHQENEIEEENDQKSASTGLLGYYAPFFGLVVVYLVLNFVVLGGLSAFTTTPGDPSIATTPVDYDIPSTTPGTDIGSVLRGNLRMLANPFSLGGTDGLIMLVALGAFLALTGIQEWEAWLLSHPIPLRKTVTEPTRPAEDDDDELVDLPELPANPLDTLENPFVPAALPEETQFAGVPESYTQAKPPAEAPEQTPWQAPKQAPLTEWASDQTPELVPERAIEPTPAPDIDYVSVLAAMTPTSSSNSSTEITPVPVVEAPVITPVKPVGRPVYRTLRMVAYGFLWTAAFVLPFVTVQPSLGVLYLASVGFSIFLAAGLTPFGQTIVDKTVDRNEVRSLFGVFELSFWLRTIAIVSVFMIYFTSAVSAIDSWNTTSKSVTGLVKQLFGL